MTTLGKLTLATALIAAQQASAQPGATEPIDPSAPPRDEVEAVFVNDATTGTVQVQADADLLPPSAVAVTPSPTTVTLHVRKDPLATTRIWGGGVRFTGLSGIGALPGVNYGGELAALVRHEELFAELAMGTWKPQHTYVVTESPQHVELGLDVWTLRGGWASMNTPLRAWGLVEVGELASAGTMPGVVARMMTGETPQERRWKAVGGGFGVAWPMSDNARLIGMLELAVPVARKTIMLDYNVGGYQPDPIAVRSSAGLELGWR
jgi:hypothetical protein